MNPLTANELWAKFDDCVSPMVGRTTAGELFGTLQNLADVERVTDLATLQIRQPPHP